MLNFAADSINDMIDMAKGQVRDFNKYIKMSKTSSIKDIARRTMCFFPVLASELIDESSLERPVLHFGHQLIFFLALYAIPCSAFWKNIFVYIL
jgi:hypothetical protein